MSIVAPRVTVDRGSNEIPVHPITAGCAKLPDWLIMDVEEALENIRSPTKKVIGIPRKGLTTKFHCIPSAREKDLKMGKKRT